MCIRKCHSLGPAALRGIGRESGFCTLDDRVVLDWFPPAFFGQRVTREAYEVVATAGSELPSAEAGGPVLPVGADGLILSPETYVKFLVKQTTTDPSFKRVLGGGEQQVKDYFQNPSRRREGYVVMYWEYVAKRRVDHDEDGAFSEVLRRWCELVAVRANCCPQVSTPRARPLTPRPPP